MSKHIPIAEAQGIADRHGVQQVIIVARDPDGDGREYVVTYGTSMEHSAIANELGRYLKHEIMGWPEEGADSEVGERVRLARAAPAMLAALEGIREVFHVHPGSDHISLQDRVEAWGDVDAAIAEAKGEAG